MSFLSKMLKAAIDTASIPVAIVQDIATLGGAVNDGYDRNGQHTYTGKKLCDIGDDVEEAKSEL